MLRRRQLPIEFTELKRLVQAAEPAAVLVQPGVLRRIISEHRDLGRLGMPVVHRKCYWIDRDRLLQYADGWELGLDSGQEPAPLVLLLVRPDLQELAAASRDELLVNYWRLLFHVHVHLALEHKLAKECIDRIEERVRQVGRLEFDEARSVLRQQDMVLPPRDSRAAFIEFAATYLEYRLFAPHQLLGEFPILADRTKIDEILARDVDAAAIFNRTRIEGAPEPRLVDALLPPADSLPSLRGAEGKRGDDQLPYASRPRRRRMQRLMRRAERVSALGNDVKAAVLLVRAAGAAQKQDVAGIIDKMHHEIACLTGRLQQALTLSDDDVKTLNATLPLLVLPAARGIWPVERRLLYDLQNVCVDHERNVYKVDLLRWAFSLGRTPLKRPLPNQREVIMIKHLRSALRRLAGARMGAEERRRLTAVVDFAVHRSEERLRHLYCPVISEALSQVGLKAENLPERVGRNKLVEELADHIIGHGHLNMSNVRDAISRNRLKLKDLHGLDEFLLGDHLLRLNNQFTRSLDGIYHKGEIYLRWLQRLSSLAFATPVGRFLTRYIALPFGGAFMLLMFIEELSHLVLPSSHHADPSHHEATGSLIVNYTTVFVLGSFLFGLFYVADFRQTIFGTVKSVFRWLRWFVYDLPRRSMRLLAVRMVVRSEVFQFFFRNAFRPLAAALVLWIVLTSRGMPALTAVQYGAALFFVGTLLLNTPWGRRADEYMSSRIARTWHRLHHNIIPGLIRGTIDFFHRVLDAINAGLYAVDEWLRFRQGESRIALGTKAVLGCFWAAVIYIVRATVNLLVEPQVNPIKHFPVVTVGHKIILPLAFTTRPTVDASPLAHILLYFFDMSVGTANGLVAAFVWLIPGIFGFLVWELKENWRLYEANRPRVLRPVVIGHHGETMVRLLRIGFHSGTIPKLCNKLRQAELEGARTGEWKSYIKRAEQLHHVEESVRHFAERELIALVEKSRVLRQVRLKLTALELMYSRIAMEFASAHHPGEHFRIAFEEQNGWLVVDILRLGWLRQLSAEELQAFRTALAGLCKMAGVDLVRPQIRAVLGNREFGFDIVNRGLLIWPRGRPEISALYRLWNGAELKPQVKPEADCAFPTLPLNAINFAKVPITWDQWLAAWREDQDGDASGHVHIEAVHVLPMQVNELRR